MALVLALVKPSFEEEVKSSSSSSLTVRDEESVNVFFRLVNNKVREIVKIIFCSRLARSLHSFEG